MHNIKKMMERLQEGKSKNPEFRNPLRYCKINDVYIPWTHKGTIQDIIDTMVVFIKKVGEHESQTNGKGVFENSVPVSEATEKAGTNGVHTGTMAFPRSAEEILSEKTPENPEYH